MPTLILTLICFLTSTFTASPPSSTSPLPHLSAAPAEVLTTSPTLLGRVGDVDPDQPGWLLFESDNDEETDDSDDQGTDSPTLSWPAARALFGIASSNPHLTVLPRSALRSPVLRC